MHLGKSYYNLFINVLALVTCVYCEYQSKPNLFERLEVHEEATEVEIKRAYRKQAVAKHPDKNQDNPHATHEFQELTEAYNILSNKKERERYRDCVKRKGYVVDCVKSDNDFGGHDHSDIFSNFFGDFGFGFGEERGRREVARGATITMDLYVTLEELYSGNFIEVRLLSKKKTLQKIRLSDFLICIVFSDFP